MDLHLEIAQTLALGAGVASSCLLDSVGESAVLILPAVEFVLVVLIFARLFVLSSLKPLLASLLPKLVNPRSHPTDQ